MAEGEGFVMTGDDALSDESDGGDKVFVVA